MLMKFYKQLTNQRDDLELLFCSFDHSEEEYFEYVEDMPWKCIPYDQKEIRTRLGMKYKAQGIPHLVVLDDTGVITLEGTTELQLDSNGTNFPWKPQTVQQILSQASSIATKDGSVDFSTLDDTYIMLYFSAHVS
jgi:hypothetical protein